jgi:hypothetical protein
VIFSSASVTSTIGTETRAAHLVRDDKRLEDPKKDVRRSRRILAKVPEHVIVGRLGHNPPIVESFDPIASVGDEAEHPLRIAVAGDGLVHEMVLDLAFDRFELVGKLFSAGTDGFQVVYRARERIRHQRLGRVV